MAPLLVGLFKITVIFLPVIFLFFFKGSEIKGTLVGAGSMWVSKTYSCLQKALTV